MELFNLTRTIATRTKTFVYRGCEGLVNPTIVAAFLYLVFTAPLYSQIKFEKAGYVGYSTINNDPELLAGALVGVSGYFTHKRRYALYLRTEAGVEWPYAFLNRVGFGVSTKIFGPETTFWLQSSIAPFVQGAEFAVRLPSRKPHRRCNYQVFLQANYKKPSASVNIDRQRHEVRIGIRQVGQCLPASPWRGLNTFPTFE